MAAYAQSKAAKATSAPARATMASVIEEAVPAPEITELPVPVIEEEDAPHRWAYPLPGLARKWDTTPMGTFGAKRSGRRPRECRRGHCGVDLHGPRGMPVVAVLNGTVTRVHRSRHGKAGRYVMITHEDGSHTFYMHLDRTRRGLQEGMTVARGEKIGTLGRTGIKRSPAHLHFAWKLGVDNGDRYRNPAAALEGARMLERPLTAAAVTASAAQRNPM